jgi:hypothetical protein
VDLVKGYHQVPVAAADVPKTAIITPFGLFEYLFMPFGLRNSAQTFQRLMDQLFVDQHSVFSYLDDHLPHTATMDEHLVVLRQFFLIVRANGLMVNRSKCEFGRPSLDFLGHRVSARGMEPLQRHVAAIVEFPPPTEVKGLQRFLGLINFYRRFLPGIALKLRPLTDALQGSPKTLLWSPDMELSFLTAKQALVAAVPLQHPDPAARISLAVDASASHVGGVMQQWVAGHWAPLAFFSRKLSTTEQKYSAFDRELLAAHSSIRHFRFLLEGRLFTLLTDHKPLVSALHQVKAPWSARQQRHLAYIAEFTADLQHTSGVDNVVADALSRPDPPVLAAAVAPVAVPDLLPASFVEMAVQQLLCREVE